MISERVERDQSTAEQEDTSKPKKTNPEPKNNWRRVRVAASRAAPLINLFAAAVVAAATVTYTVYASRQWHTMRNQLREMRSSSGQIDQTIAALQSQADSLKSQLLVMATEAKIRRAELAGKMLSNVTEVPQPGGGWHVTTRWLNVGKTDVRKFWNWESFAVLRDPKEWRTIDFLKPLPGQQVSPSVRDIVVPREGVSETTRVITVKDAEDSMAGNAIPIGPITWGHIEYWDIFDTFYSVNYCHMFNFSRTAIGVIVINLPVDFSGQ